jgi:hypothetical protein
MISFFFKNPKLKVDEALSNLGFGCFDHSAVIFLSLFLESSSQSAVDR